MDFLWHKVSEQEKEKIKQEAKNIMDSFAQSLAKAPEIKEKLVERKESTRQEKEGKEAKPGFRRIMFENAPEKEGDCIKAEKGAWTK